MQQIFDKVTYLVGDGKILSGISNVTALPLFADVAVDFLSEVSREILQSKEAKQYPDVSAFGFWIRRASLERARKEFCDGAQQIGRGVAFHIAPSNIPVQFAVSLVYALTAGNASVIRLSSKSFPQVDLLCGIINDVIACGHQNIAPYICIVRYEHDDAVTQYLSSICDIRIIWGGDATIANIRKAKISPRCLDIGFADRYSFAVIDADALLQSDMNIVVQDFYYDTYYTDQNACSSTRLVVWVGNEIASAKEKFWRAVGDIARKKYELHNISGSDKLLHTAVLAVKHPEIREIREDNQLVRVVLPELYEDIMDYKGNSGYFFEYDAASLEDIVPILGKGCQTITFVGDLAAKLHRIVQENGVRGVDRIVPLGHSVDLSYVWDGYVLPEVLSRRVSDL